IESNDETKIRGRYWGDSSLAEISAADRINIWGNWTDASHTVMTARLIRDLSNMKRVGVMIGTVESTNANGFVIATINKGNQNVIPSSKTKYIDRKGASINSSSISTGSKVRVRGTWDKSKGSITQVT